MLSSYTRKRFKKNIFKKKKRKKKHISHLEEAIFECLVVSATNRSAPDSVITLYFDHITIPGLVLCNGRNMQVKFGLTAIYQYLILLGENYGNLRATLLTVAAIKSVSKL